MRTWLALLAAKAARTASRLLGHGGSNLPGKVARRLDPRVLRHLAARPRQGNILITGTNGKTTSAGLVSGIAEQAGFSLVHNRAGANLITGITTAFVSAVSLTGRCPFDYGLLEVDEATMPQAVLETVPHAVAVTNFFPDQLDRFATLADTIGRVRDGIERLPATAVLILNADDPEVAQLASAHDGPVLFFGLAADVSRRRGTVDAAGPPQLCVQCGTPLHYAVRFYAHLGVYDCPNCGWRRPDPDIVLTGWTPEPSGGATLQVKSASGTSVTTRLHVPGFYNVYNALTAIATGMALGWSVSASGDGVARYEAEAGRMERRQLYGREARIALVKNPVGCDEVLRTMLHDARPKVLLMALNDRAGDGTDIAWIWDAHFEWLATDANGPAHVVCAGTRAADLAIRLKYAGFEPERLHVTGSPAAALQEAAALVRPGQSLYVLPTYSAMLELQPAFGRASTAAAPAGGKP